MEYQIASSLALREVGTESFALDRTGSVVHTFNDTGAFLWQQIRKGATIDQMIMELCMRFDVDEAKAKADVWEFLNTCEEKRLVRLTR